MSITERIDNITKVSENLSPFAPIPKSVKIEITSRCNLKCNFCAHSKELRKTGDMDRSLFERLAIEIRQAGVEELGCFYLGESFLVPWLWEAVRFAKYVAKFPYVFITTNGTLMTEGRCSQLFRAGLDSLKVSLNYADANQFQNISGMPARIYPTIIRNIKGARAVRERVLQETGHRCGIYASYIQYDGQQGERMNQVVAEVSPYVDEIYALPLYSQAELVGEQERDRGWNVTAGNRGRLDAMREPLPCWAVFTEGHITWDGKLAACCFSHQGFEMADLTKVSFVEGWNSEKFQALRAAHIAKDVRGTECETCVAYA